MGVYSFLSVQASISGPGGNLPLGNGAAAAEEGITFAMNEDKNTMTLGAGGEGMHSLHAAKGGTVTIRLLKTSPVNAALMEMYNLQTSNPALHGRNTLSVRDTFRGDVAVARECAFKKVPDLTWAKDGNTNEWLFDAVSIDPKLGAGLTSFA